MTSVPFICKKHSGSNIKMTVTWQFWEVFACLIYAYFGSVSVSEKLCIYPSPKPTLTLTCYPLTIVELGKGYIIVLQLLRCLHWSTISHTLRIKDTSLQPFQIIFKRCFPPKYFTTHICMFRHNLYYLHGDSLSIWYSYKLTSFTWSVSSEQYLQFGVIGWSTSKFATDKWVEESKV